MSHEACTRSKRAWSAAWNSANARFYAGHLAEENFRTSIESGTEVARTLARLITDQHARRRGDDFLVIDVGSGSGRLLEQLATLVPKDITLMGVDVRRRPSTLDPRIDWRQIEIDDSTENITGSDGDWVGVVIAHEFLDDIPCTVAELDECLVPRVVLVDEITGSESIGPALHDTAARRLLGHATDEHCRWLHEWWPATRPMARREIGIERERIWTKLTRIVSSGCAVAIDYAHRRDDRSTGLWDAGTVRGFARGRPRSAIPDGSVNITAHVALDALASSRATVRAQHDVLARQSLRSWPHGLGAYAWLVEPIMRR